MQLEEKDPNGWGRQVKPCEKWMGKKTSSGLQSRTGLTLSRGQNEDSWVNASGIKYLAKDEKTL